MRLPRVIAVVALAGACHRAPPARPTVPEPALPAATVPLSNWPVVLAAATRAAEAGDYARADRVLLEHGVRHAGTPEGSESDYWRAVFRADPSNTGHGPRERIAIMDAYLAGGPQVAHAVEATVLRRLLESVDSVSAVLATVRTNSEQRLRARDEELRRLSDELDRTSAELERIRKRLAPGKPPVP